MKKSLIKILPILLNVIALTHGEDAKKIVCYYTFPSDTSSLQPEKIDPDLCTHVLVGFVFIQNCTLMVSENANEHVQRVLDLKRLNSNLKVMISIGGGGVDAGFPEMIRSKENRTRFIKSLDAYMNQIQIDGFDLDWEFPSYFKLKDEFTELLKEMRNHIDNSVNPYLLSVAVASPITIVTLSYDISAINKYVDFINLMCYDYNFFSLLTPWTAMNAPLYKRSVDVLYFATQNINYTANFWFQKGADKDKLIVGLPVYGHTYTLANPQKNYLGAPAIGNGKLGGGGGSVFSSDICDFMRTYNLKTIFDEETKSPYVTHDREWVSMENFKSIEYKAKFVKESNFGGVMVFSLSSDDYKGTCSINKMKFPLTKMIHKIMTGQNF